MSRKNKKKLDEDGEEVKEDLLGYFDTIDTVIIYGQKLKRIPYNGSEGNSCPDCHTETKALHFVCCRFEYCPWCHGFSLQCLCDPDILNAERDGYIECLEGTDLDEV